MFGAIKVNENGESDIIKRINAAVWRFRYTFICQSKSVAVNWSV